MLCRARTAPSVARAPTSRAVAPIPALRRSAAPAVRAPQIKAAPIALARFAPARSYATSNSNIAEVCALTAGGVSLTHSQDANFRVEADTFGPLKVPKNRYYGAQTQRYVISAARQDES